MTCSQRSSEGNRGLLVALLALCMLVSGMFPASAEDSSDASEAAFSGVETIAPEALSRGQKGYGLSVFAGYEVERFEVEVLGIQRLSTPGQDFIMARLSGQGLEHSGVAAGMSGSPVYFDGRLAGAVAYSYLFGKDAIAGITPIDSMRTVARWPSVLDAAEGSAEVTNGADVATSLAPTWQEMVEGDFDVDALAQGLQRLLGGAPSASLHGTRSAVTWTASGFSEPARRLLSGAVGGGLAPSWGPSGGSAGGGTAAPATAMPELQAGSGMAVVLVDGDQQLAAHGTVTERWGDELVGFGHPMYGLGPVDLPLATSEVITVIASVANSFKLSNPGRLVGTLDQDRLTGVRGRLGRIPEMTELNIRTRGEDDHDYALRVAKMPQLRPLMIAISVLGSLDASDRAAGRLGLDMEVTFDLGDDGVLDVAQSFDGSDAALNAATFLLGHLAFLDLNAWKRLDIRRVDVTLQQHKTPRLNTLVGAQPAVRRVQPGQRLPVVLELEAWRGERFRRHIEVTIPETAPPGSYWLMVGDGTSVDALRLAIEKDAPETLAASLQAIDGLHSRRQLSVLGMRGAPGLTLDGHALPALPESLRTLFAQGQTTEQTALRLVIDQQTHMDLEEPMEGALRIDLEVQARRP